MAGIGKPHLACGAVQQFQAELGFQLGDTAADRRLGQPHLVASAAEIAGNRHGLEHLQLAQRDIHAVES